MPRLVAQSEAIAGQVYQLEGKVISLGSDEENAIQIEDDSVSSKHAELRLDHLDYKVKDLGSTNGTRVNGERIVEIKLRRNDVVGFGNIKLRYESEHAPQVKALPEPEPLPDLSRNSSKGRPADFSNPYQTTPVPREEKEEEKPKKEPEQEFPWNILLILAGILAVASLIFFIYKILS